MDSVPLSYVVAIVTGLTSAIVAMFYIVMDHHNKSITDLRTKEARLIEQLDKAHRMVDRGNRALALHVGALFFTPKPFKDEAARLAAEVDEEERTRTS